MASKTTITLLGKQYPIKFGMKFQSIYMKHLGIDKISEYQKALQSAAKLESQKGFESFGFLVISAVQAAAKKELDFDVHDVLDDVIYDEEKQHQIMLAFQEAQPKPKKLGKQKA